MQFRIYHSSGVPLALALHCRASLKSFLFYSTLFVSDINCLFVCYRRGCVPPVYTYSGIHGGMAVTEILQCTRRLPLLVAWYLLSRPILLIIHSRSLPSDDFRSFSELVISPPDNGKSTRPTINCSFLYSPVPRCWETLGDHASSPTCVMASRCE